MVLTGIGLSTVAVGFVLLFLGVGLMDVTDLAAPMAGLGIFLMVVGAIGFLLGLGSVLL